MPRKSKSKFKMKGHALPGINQKSETVNLSDGRSPSSAFQMNTSYKMKEAAAKMKVPFKQERQFSYSDEELLNVDPNILSNDELERLRVLKSTTPTENVTSTDYGDDFITNLESINLEAGDVSETDFSKPDVEDVKEAKRIYDGIGIPGAIEELSLLAAKLKKRRQERRKNKENKEFTVTTSDEDLVKETKNDIENQEKEESGEYKSIKTTPTDDNQKEETVETKDYTVKSGDNLTRIARANNMSLAELLDKNPEYKKNPNFVRRGATLNL
jgi:LysM repeat protein